MSSSKSVKAQHPHSGIVLNYSKPRCQACSKRKIIIQACKCGNMFCLQCLGKHAVEDCDFDYRKDQKKKLSKEMTKCVPKKMDHL